MPQGVKDHRDTSKSRKRPDKINASPGSTNPHSLAGLKSHAGLFNELRSQPSPGASDELKFAFLSEFSWAAWDYTVWRASSPKPKNCLEPPPLVSKPGKRSQGRQVLLQNSQKTRGFLCLQGKVVKFYCWFWEQLILKLSSGRKRETTAWGWAEGTEDFMVFLSPRCPYSQAGEGLRQELWETLVLLLWEWGGCLICREIMFSQFLLQFWGCVSWLCRSQVLLRTSAPSHQLGGISRNPSWEGQGPGQTLWMQLGQMRALGNPSTSNSIPMLSSYFPGWKKSRLQKVSFQLLNLPLRPHPPTPTNGPCSSEGHSAQEQRNRNLLCLLSFLPGCFASWQSSAALTFLAGPLWTRYYWHGG